MISTRKPSTYEEERLRIIEENKRRMEELGLFETIESLQKPRTPRKWIRKVPSVVWAMETRRSSRAASRPKVDYKEGGMDIGLRRTTTKTFARPLKRRGYVSPAAKNEAAERAGNIETTHPSFVKAMLKSHTSGGFWLGLPSDFCNNNFNKDDIVILEDEDGLEWECVYLHHKRGLSGGWRGFSIDHDLEDGDAVLFELVTSTRFKVYITRAAVSEQPSTKKTTAAVKKREYQYVVTGSKNEHVHSALHKSLKLERGDQFEGRVCKRSKSAKPVKRNVRSRYDWDSDESQESEEVVQETSDDNSDATSESVIDCDEEDDVQSSEEEAEEASEEEAEVASEDEAEQSSDSEVHPARNLKDKISRPTRRSLSSKQESPVIDLEDSNEEPEQESDDDIQPTKNLKEKISKTTTRPVKSKQQPKGQTHPKPRQITPGRKESSRASVKVAKKESFLRRTDRKTDIQDVRKEISAHQIEQKCNLPSGARLKPVGVCSIARGSGKRKLPAVFPARKFSFFSGTKSVKVH